MTDQNTLSAAFEVVFDSKISGVHTQMPGQVVSYDYKSQKADIQPLIKKRYSDGTVESFPILTNVPIILNRTKNSGITFPINKGDGVLIEFTERSLENWYLSGQEVEPGDPRKFDLSDSVAIVGLFSFKDDNLASNNEDLEIHHGGQKITITSDGDIKIGTQSLKKLVTEEFKAIFDSHVHNVSTVGSPAAQAGITSSPAQFAGLEPVEVTAVPTPTLFTFGTKITDSQLTDKVTAE